ncbi:FAD-dependent oxidoreductase [Brevibacterium atlanticum]|uniref:FAD-dependent oxidoreductase n=1 Tax=Brevibacterium atlanticum TaxID=2697563 RepID=UPI001D17D7FA|nr:FAD-dependent oxidoreductase [Brevibacterium atlanticum]
MSISRVAVVGAGLLGLTAAREITQRLPDAEVTVFDKADGVAAHQSGHTSGIVDSGLEQIPGSEAAELARRGVERLVPYMAENGVPYRECGQLLVAQNTDEAERLEELFTRAKDNEVPGARLLDRREIATVEPAARGVLGLFAPHAAVADFAALTEALAADVRAAGGAIRLSTEVTDFDAMSNEVRLRGRVVEPGARDGRGAEDDAGGAGDSHEGNTGDADRGGRAGGSSGSDNSGEDGIDDQVYDRPRTYRGSESREPVIGIGDELRSRFGEQDWFRQAESTIGEWAERLSSSWSRGSDTHGTDARGSGRDSDRASGNERGAAAGAPAEEVLGSFDIVIVCAGLQADRLAVAAGFDERPRIVPFTCDYYTAQASGTGRPSGPESTSGTGPTSGTAEVRGIIGTVPDPNAPFAETSIIRGLGHSLTIGPNTFVALGRESYARRGFDLGDIGSTARFKGFWKFAAQTAKTAAKGVKTVVSKSAFIDEVRRIVPELDADTVNAGTRGVRAQAMNDDGELVDDLTVTRRGRLTVVRAVPKWGATSALAIAESVVDRALEGGPTSSPGR